MPSLCVSLYSIIVLLSACQRLSALCIGCSVYWVLYYVCLLCSAAVVLYISTSNVFFLWSLQHFGLGWSVCLPTTLCCLLVCQCIFRAVRVHVKGWSNWRQARRGCMVSAERSVFWCPLVGAESDSCGRNGRWKGLIFRHSRVHVPKIRVQFCVARCTKHIFLVGRVKTCVDQSAQLISRWM